jgi:hypothetical protein
MNLSKAITIALKELRAGGQKITDEHRIFIHAIDGKLTVTALKKDLDESIAVRLPFRSSMTLCGTFCGHLKKLLRLIQNEKQEWTQGLDDRGDFLQVTGETFTYRFDLTGHLLNIKKTIDLTIDNTVHSAIIEKESDQSTETIMKLIISNDYFTDLAAAVKAGLFAGKGKNPKKADLYAAIDAHNAKCNAEPIAVEESIGTPTTAYDMLLTQWKERKTTEKVKSVKVAAVRENRGVSGKSLDKSEVWPADRIRAVKRSSQMGRVLEYMFNNEGIAFVETDGLELTKAQFTQAIGSISEAGYGIRKDNDRFTVILPKELEAPKLK